MSRPQNQDPDATATIESDHRRQITIERYGKVVVLTGPLGGQAELIAPENTESVANGLQAVVPKAWKD